MVAWDIRNELEVLKTEGLGITDAIVSLNEVFKTKYGITPYRINCGDCEDYSDCLAYLVPGCEGFWGDELTSETDDVDQYSYHYVTRYKGKFYDAETPFGVSDFRDISAFNQ